MSAPFLEKLLVPHSTDDWLDRRAMFETQRKRREGVAFALKWIDEHHPRFRGREAK
jgi:hypothetical protein